MIIHNGNKKLSFVIDNYEFPDHKSRENYDYDANWLVAAIKYADENISEEYKDSCILTWELEELIEAVSNVLSGEETLYISDFTEPYLKFVAAQAKNDILFGIEFVYDTDDGVWKKRKLSEVISKETAQQSIDELRSMAERFPKR